MSNNTMPERLWVERISYVDVVLYVNGTVSAEPLQAPICDLVIQTGMVSLETQSTPVVAVSGANRAPVYCPVFSVAERDELETLGGIRAVLEAGKRALTLEVGNE